MRVLELYCGIGGCAAALGEAAEVVQAVDINKNALEVYRLNFRHPTTARTLDTISESELCRGDPELRWLSPPCQPFTTRGHRRDLEDPRAKSFLWLMEKLGSVRPRHMALENVPGFVDSEAHSRLLSTLKRFGYRYQEHLICPSELGLPNRRRRYYLVASHDDLVPLAVPQKSLAPLQSYLDPNPSPELVVNDGTIADYGKALDRVRADDPGATTACFTSAYGRSPVRSGSYLESDQGLRRFSPREILRLLGYPRRFLLPPGMPLSTGWRLVGNSLSIPPVRLALSQLPKLQIGA